MSQRRLGIAVGRRNLRAVGLERMGREYALCARWQTHRAPGESLAACLERLIGSIPVEWRGGEFHLALSPVDLACADLLEVPYRNENQLVRVAPSLAEGRCAGETIEELAIDVLMAGRAGDGSSIQLAAARRSILQHVNALVARLMPKAETGLITALPFALLRSVPEGDGLWGVPLGAAGEGAVWVRKGGEVRALRVFPMGEGWSSIEERARALDSQSEQLHVLDGAVHVRGLQSEPVEPDELAAVGAGLLDPDRSLNLLRGMPDAPRSAMEHIRGPLMASAVAATVLFVAAGLYFDLCARQHERDLARCARKEQEAWKVLLPSEPYRQGSLAGRLQREAQRSRLLQAGNEQVSALRLWAELAGNMPDPDQIRLTLEELKLDRRGGRLQAKVPVDDGQPLANAALIESMINRSAVLSARGEFDRRDAVVTVRMNLDYKPQGGRERAP